MGKFRAPAPAPAPGKTRLRNAPAPAPDLWLKVEIWYFRSVSYGNAA